MAGVEASTDSKLQSTRIERACWSTEEEGSESCCVNHLRAALDSAPLAVNYDSLSLNFANLRCTAALSSSSTQSNRIVIWYCRSDTLSASNRANLVAMLSAEELHRMERFKLAHTQDLFLVAHAMKRAMLCEHLGVGPTQLSFSEGPYGKPIIETSASREPLDFSISHSKHMAVMTLSTLGQIGVDIESTSKVPHLEVFERIFASQEMAELLPLEGEELRTRSMLAWTAREAFSKAVGLGMSLPPEDVVFSTERQSLEMKSVSSKYGHHTDWRLFHTTIADSYQLATALQAGQRLNIEWRVHPWRRE